MIGFNDTGSIPESVAARVGEPAGTSVSGFAFSTNQGSSFTDGGFVNPGAERSNLLLGDPVVACTDAATFDYSQLFETGTSTPLSAVGISKSINGGASGG